MTKAKINGIIAVLAIIMLIMTSTVVFAANETETSGTSAYKVTMALDAGDSKLKEGSTVTVDVNITKVEGGSGIVGGIGASLDYDKNVFEPISESKETAGVGVFKSDSCKMASGWSITGNMINEQTGAFTLLGGAGQKEGKVMTLTFKVKNTINVDSTTITLSAITATDSDNEVEVPTTRVTISRDKKAETKTDTSTITKVTPKTTTNTTTTTKKVDNTTAQKKIPKTGLSESGIAVIATIVIVGGICYVVYRRKYNDVK